MEEYGRKKYIYLCEECGEPIFQRLDTIKNMERLVCRHCTNIRKAKEYAPLLSKIMKAKWSNISKEERIELSKHFQRKECIEKRRQSMIQAYKNGLVPWNKGMKGSNSHMWVKDRSKVKSPLNKQIRGSMLMKKWKIKIFKRDTYICQLCHKKGGNLNAHHIIPYSNIINDFGITIYDDSIDCEELWNISNGITLCKECHKIVHSIGENVLSQQ